MYKSFSVMAALKKGLQLKGVVPKKYFFFAVYCV